MRALLVLTLLAVLTACAQITLVKPERQDFGGVYSVQPTVAWNQLDAGPATVWTNNGVTLEVIRFYAGLEEGEVLFQNRRERRNYPSFDADMRAPEIMEFVVDSLSTEQYGQVTPRELIPADFGSLPGYRFGFSMLSSKGLELEGLAIAAIHDGKLNLIIYYGPRLYYFPKYRDEVEAIIQSITVSA